MKEKKRIIVNIDFINQDKPSETVLNIKGIEFSVVNHNIGWDFQTAKALIAELDGYVDAFSFRGFNVGSTIAKLDLQHKPSLALLNSVKKSKVYTGRDIRQFFTNWTLLKLLRVNPNLLKGKKTLFHCALFTPSIDAIASAGANIVAADPLTIGGMPFTIKGMDRVYKMAKLLKPFLENVPVSFVRPSGGNTQPGLQNKLRSWIQDCDVFVTFASMLERIGTLEILEGKTLVIDAVKPAQRKELKESGVSKILELVPDLPVFNNIHLDSFSLLYAIIDLLRQSEDSNLTFDEYLLQFIEENELKPNSIEILGSSVQRCGFILHPLSRNDLLKAPKLSWMNNLPKSTGDFAEKFFARLPLFYHGRIDGIKSISSGQEVICEIYVLPATTKQIVSMNENQMYRRLIDSVERARRDGCGMVGLGAYTKVIGDAGYSVAKGASIPVTNGNSYSAAATLWAAREMITRLGFIKKPEEGKKLDAKAMVIGASGSIGRISARLLSLAIQRIVLIAPRIDRLLELREEILEMTPNTEITIATNPDLHLFDTDLIVTATSNVSGKVLDIEAVKPGAVICDCSRPLDISIEEAAMRPDVMVIESGEIDLPGDLKFTCDIGLPEPSVYACLAETVLLAMDNRLESFSLGKELSLNKVKEIYKIGLKHGAKLSAIRGPFGVVSEEDVLKCRSLAQDHLARWTAKVVQHRSSAAAKSRKIQK